MKKFLIITTALLLTAGATKAAGTKENTAAKSSVENRMASALTPAAAARSFAEILEENMMLREQVQQLNAEKGSLESKLEYSWMMHASLSNLDQELLNASNQDAQTQAEYARMMTTSLVSLGSVLANAK